MAIAASPAQINFIKNLLADRQHADNGKTILVGETRFRTTTDKIGTISKAVASRMITALKGAEMKPSEERKPEGPHFRRLGGKWMVAGVENGKPGDAIEVRTKAGDIRRVTLVNSAGSAMWEFEDVEKRAPAPRRSSYRRTRSTYRRRRNFECPRCGEEEGSMFNHGVCDECGYTEHAAEGEGPAVEQDAPAVEAEQAAPEPSKKIVVPVPGGPGHPTAAIHSMIESRPAPARIQQEATRITEAQEGRAAIYAREQAAGRGPAPAPTPPVSGAASAGRSGTTTSRPPGCASGLRHGALCELHHDHAHWLDMPSRMTYTRGRDREKGKKMQNTTTQAAGLLDLAIRLMEAGNYTWTDVYAEVAKNLSISTDEAAQAVAARYMATR